MVERHRFKPHPFPAALNLACLAIVAVALTSCCGPQPQSCCGDLAASRDSAGIPAEGTADAHGGSGGPESTASNAKNPSKVPNAKTAATLCDQLVPHSRPPKADNPLLATPFGREGALSCWSTCGEIIMDYIGGIRVRQCCQSTRALSKTLDCCDSTGSLPANGDCDKDGYPDFLSWGFYGGVGTSVLLSWQ